MGAGGAGIGAAGWTVGRGLGTVAAAGRGTGTVGAGVSATPTAGRGGGGVGLTVPAADVIAGCVEIGSAGAAVTTAGRGGATALSKPRRSFLRVLGEMLMPTEPEPKAGAGSAAVAAPGFPAVPVAS
jgi:hypothetical protein